MNFIEAFQKAENGELITNNFLQWSDSFLKYIGGGVFYQYIIINNKAIYKYEVREFNLAYIIAKWELVEDKFFNK